jgi:lipooligosaccharide transport system permease protein
VVMVVMGLTSAGLAVIAFFAAMLVGFAFGALGMALSTFLRSWQDFDLMTSAQFALFLFSGTFVPAHDYPAVLRWVVEVTPLYRSVDLVRGVTTASWSWVQLTDIAYLLGLVALGLAVAGRRMGTLLCK